MAKDIEQGDWIIREGPEIRLGDLGAYSGDLPNPLTLALGQREFALALAFTQHAVFVMDATASHIVVFDPLDSKPNILQLSWFAGTWRLASRVQVETTWSLAKSMNPQNGALIDMAVKQYPWRAR